jgi:hypothetical protein
LLCPSGDEVTVMTTQAPLHPSEQAGVPGRDQNTVVPPHEQVTDRLEAGGGEPILDSLPLLDHRTRSQAVGRRLAPFGHYLAFAQDGAEWLVPLDNKVTHIGRGVSSDVRIEALNVSRSHAIIVRNGHHTRLLDNRSANGTFVNGRPIVATNVSDGDVIRLGPVVMTYVHIT